MKCDLCRVRPHEGPPLKTVAIVASRGLHPKDFDELFEAEPSKLFAQAVGLEHYDWLAYDYMARDFHESPEEHADVTEVS